MIYTYAGNKLNPNNLSDMRMMRGMAISQNNAISENVDGSFAVPSQTQKGIQYRVSIIEGKWICNCPDNYFRQTSCKHIYGVQFWIAIRTYFNKEQKPKIFSQDACPCDRCGSIRVMRYGMSCDKQVYKCKDCNHKFREESLLKKARYNPDVITITLDLYFKGISLRKISDHLHQFYGLETTHMTIYRWLDRYINIMDAYVSTLTPQLSGKWNVDEMAIKARGGHSLQGSSEGQYKWLWNVLDKETRFQLASEISETKTEVDGMLVLQKAKAIAKAVPKKITTDKLGSYPMAIERAFINEKEKPIHRRIVSGAGTPHANEWAERLHNTIRERNKVQRGWKKDDTPLRNGQKLYYNFIRPHQTLDGKTPAQKAGIEVANGQNRWMELLKKAITDA